MTVLNNIPKCVAQSIDICQCVQNYWRNCRNGWVAPAPRLLCRVAAGVFVIICLLKQYFPEDAPSTAVDPASSEDERIVHGFYVCNLRRLRTRDNCTAFSFGGKKSLAFEKKLSHSLGERCKIIVYREQRPGNIDIPPKSISYFDGKLADYDNYNASNDPHEAILETIVARHMTEIKIPLMVFDIGRRSVNILTSRLLKLRACQVILRVHARDLGDARVMVYTMMKAMYMLVSVRQVHCDRKREACSGGAKGVTAATTKRGRVADYAGVYHMTFCNLQCFEDFDCDRKPPSDGYVMPTYMKRTLLA